MILDSLVVFADAQALTNSGAATDTVDTLASGSSYFGNFLVVRVDTAYTSQGTAVKNQWQLQTSDDATFADSTTMTLVQSGAFLASQLTAGKFVPAIRIPLGMKRYIRVYKVISANGAADYFTAGKFDAFIVLDVSHWNNKRYLLQ